MNSETPPPKKFLFEKMGEDSAEGPSSVSLCWEVVVPTPRGVLDLPLFPRGTAARNIPVGVSLATLPLVPRPRPRVPRPS